MTDKPKFTTEQYSKVYQAIIREWNVPPRGKAGSPENRARQSLLPRVHYETLRRLKNTPHDGDPA